jgi:hypothetical protein
MNDNNSIYLILVCLSEPRNILFQYIICSNLILAAFGFQQNHVQGTTFVKYTD